MDMSVVADWVTVLFFLWFGLKTFIPALEEGVFRILGAILALGTAIFIALSV